MSFHFRLLCLLTFAISPASAELVTSRLDLVAGQQQVFLQSAASGPVADKQTVSTPGQSVSGQSATLGIGTMSLAQYPASGSFLTTDLFTTRAEANQAVAQASGNASAISSLTRSGRWRVDALQGGMNFAVASVQLTFRYTWAQRVQGSDSAQLSLGYLVDSGSGGGDSFVVTLQGDGGLTNSNGTSLWTSAFEIPIHFGIAFDLDWTLSNAAVVSAGPGFSSIAKGSAELWQVQVRDASGNLLTRFVDYDIVELSTAQNTTFPAAPGAILPPRVPVTTLDRDANGNLLINFSGDLQESTDLVHWSVVDPTLMGPYLLPQPLVGRRFFRAYFP